MCVSPVSMLFAGLAVKVIVLDSEVTFFYVLGYL